MNLICTIQFKYIVLLWIKIPAIKIKTNKISCRSWKSKNFFKVKINFV